MTVYNIMDFVLEHQNHYTLWYYDDRGGFLVNDGRLVFTSTLEDIRKIPQKNDKIEAFVLYQYCDDLMVDQVDCHKVLEFWNCMSDMADRLSIPFTGDREEGMIQQVYEKLYHGCYDAVDVGWSLEERECLLGVIREGKRMLKDQFSKER